jgi:glutaredoxin
LSFNDVCGAPLEVAVEREGYVTVRACVLACVLAVVVVVVAACSKTPADGAVSSSSSSSSPDAAAPDGPVVRAEATNLLFSFVDAAGRVQAVPSVADVPEAVRKRVLVVDVSKTPEQRQAHRYAWFTDLTVANADGTYPVVVVSRYDGATQKQGASSLPPPEGSVVIYSAEWCGYCKKAKAWMTSKGVPYIERDVDKSPGAQAELQAKLKVAGVPGGGIPVVDWAGSIVVGFDVPAFEKLLASSPPPTPTTEP